jgi:hypothetical protein
LIYTLAVTENTETTVTSNVGTTANIVKNESQAKESNGKAYWQGKQKSKRAE